MFRQNCLVCNSKNLNKIIDLGIHPFADTFISEDKLSQSEPVYPLICDLCEDCGHVQTSCETKPEERYFLLNDYSYTSSNSSFATQHWEEYAKTIIKKVNLDKGAFVVEIGSNDGFLSEQFFKTGFKVLGVDPSEYMAKIAKKRNIDTFVDLFTKNTANKILEKYGKAELIIANNVFNHADNPLNFVQGVKDLLSQQGVFVFEQPYWLTSIKSRKIDQVYHEHVSYYSVKSAKRLLEQVGMIITDVEEVNYHGGSLRIFARLHNSGFFESDNVSKMIQVEDNEGLFNKNKYLLIMQEILQKRNSFLKEIYELKEKGYPIIAVGAPAKGNTFLNFYALNKTVINYVTDSSSHKQGKYTPLTRIPIVNDEIFSKFDEPYALVLSWNLIDKLKPNLEKINPKIKFIAPM